MNYKSSLDRHIQGLDDPNAPFNKDPIEWYSNCCGVEMKGLDLDYGICPECLEPCEIVALDEDGNEVEL